MCSHYILTHVVKFLLMKQQNIHFDVWTHFKSSSPSISHFIPDIFSLPPPPPFLFSPLPISPSLRHRRRGCCHGNNRSRGCSGPFLGKPSSTSQGTDHRGGNMHTDVTAAFIFWSCRKPKKKTKKHLNWTLNNQQ